MAKLSHTFSLIVRVAIPVPIDRLFDYKVLDQEGFEGIKPGVRVKVPFGKNQKTGIVVAVSDTTELDIEKLKEVEQILDTKPLLNKTDLDLLHWSARYYHHPLGEVFSAAFPVGLRQGKTATSEQEKIYSLTCEGRMQDSAALKRAPKQKKLLEKFQNETQAVSESLIASWMEGWKLPVKSLLKKKLLQINEVNPSQLPVIISKDNELPANASQRIAIDEVKAALGKFKVYLLEGVTGSGKTEVYMQIIRTVLERGDQVLVLLPEITLTPQLEQRFRERFAVPIAVSHSKLSDGQRQKAWLKMQTGACSILLGTRSALFTSLKKPGLIILDEEHDGSFKQQEGFRFSARNVAVVRSKLLKIPVLMGSATPSFETLFNVEQKRYHFLNLAERAGTAVAPTFRLLDIRNKRMQEGLSEPLISAINMTLARKEQVLIFLNRRGFAPTLICHSCGWVARCRHCEANLVIHYDEKRLRCHHCAGDQILPSHCPGCKTGSLTPLGLGTERIEKVLLDLFPDKKILRLDRDTTQRKGVLEDYLEQIHQGSVDIILGTQMLAKGHHFPNVTLAVLVDVDSGLFSIDFHAPEKLAQLIVQVAGRAGRAEKPGQVILQTRQPEHPLLTTLIKDGYRQFAKIALAERKAAGLPPYSYQALLRVEAVESKIPVLFLEQVVAMIGRREHVQILGPVSAPMTKRAGRYRYQLLFQSIRRGALHSTLDDLRPGIEKLKLARKVRWSLDVDPVDLY